MDYPLATQINQGSLIQLYLAVLITFSLGVAFIVFCVVYLRKLFTQKLEMQQLESEYRKSLLDSTLQAQESERKRMALDLHDGIGAMLSTTKLYASHLHEGMEAEVQKQISGKVITLLDESVVSLRRLSQNLLPVGLENFGLIHAVEDLCEQVQKSHADIDLVFNATEDINLSSEQDIHLFRIVQELINNTLKHAKATKIELALQLIDGDIIFNYRDNGIGFDASSVKSPSKAGKSLGMKSIASRAEILNAQLDIESAPNQGLAVTITFPY